MKKELREILIKEGITLKELSEILLISYGHARNSMSESTETKAGSYQNWIRSFVEGYKMGEKSGLKRNTGEKITEVLKDAPNKLVEEVLEHSKKIEATPMKKEMPVWKVKMLEREAAKKKSNENK